FVDYYHLKLPIGIDTIGVRRVDVGWGQYGASATPTFVVVDAQGVMQTRLVGWSPRFGQVLASALDRVLAGKRGGSGSWLPCLCLRSRVDPSSIMHLARRWRPRCRNGFRHSLVGIWMYSMGRPRRRYENWPPRRWTLPKVLGLHTPMCVSRCIRPGRSMCTTW